MGIWSAHAAEFLGALTVATLLFYALPLLLAPLAWARVRGWPPAHFSMLAVFLGRCLGAVSMAMVITALRAMLNGGALQTLDDFALAFSVLMTIVQLAGGRRGEHPSRGHIEAALWSIVCALSVLLYPD